MLWALAEASSTGMIALGIVAPPGLFPGWDHMWVGGGGTLGRRWDLPS